MAHSWKKLDQEPGRCRRTDGKKWRCSKEAYPESKYCERHMHRGKYRSRKPVETQAQLQLQLALSGSGSSRNLHNVPMQQFNTNEQIQLNYGIGSSRSYEMARQDFRYPYGNNTEHVLCSEVSKATRGIGVPSSHESSWDLMPSMITSFSASTIPYGCNLQSNHHQLSACNDFAQSTIISLQKQDHTQDSLFSHDFVSVEPLKQSHVQPFFDEWPNTRCSWSDMEESKSKLASSSTTQLSISLPMVPSDFGTFCARSPKDD